MKGCSSEEAKKKKLLEKIASLDATSELYDTMYSDLERVLLEINRNIDNYKENINKKELAIANATSKALTFEQVYDMMKAFLERFEDFPDADKQRIMGAFLDHVELYEKKLDGHWVKKIRFKVPLAFPDGKLYDEVSYVTENFLPKVTTDETVVLLTRQ